MLIYYNHELNILGILSLDNLIQIDESNLFIPLTNRWVLIGDI